MARRTAAAAALVLAVLAAGCDDDHATATKPPPTATGSTTTPAPPPGSTPSAHTSPTNQVQPDDPSLDPALSTPVEDSVYPDVGDPSVDALHYGLTVRWDPAARTITGEAVIDLRSTATGDHLQLDLDSPLQVTLLTLDGKQVDYDHTGKDLVIHAAVVKDQRYRLDIGYVGAPQPTAAPTTRSDFSTSGWTDTSDGGAWTMQEPYGAFTWYPVNDQPADKAFYDISITAPDPMVGIANGTLLAQGSSNGLTTTTWHLDEPASSYVVTVAIGDYTESSNTSASGVKISYWVPSDEPSYAASLEKAADGLDWLEAKLGPYPFASLGFVLVDSQSGMETQTMITLGETQYATSEAVLVHEMAHQWYGDEVTPADWSDVWMNEGMAMYLQDTWQAEHDGVSVEKVLDGYAQAEAQSRREDGPPGDYDPTTFGEGNIYYGPAFMWDELRKKIGDDRFWAVVKAWPARAPETAVTRQAYLDWLVQQTGVPESFFDGWLLDATTPART